MVNFSPAKMSFLAIRHLRKAVFLGSLTWGVSCPRASQQLRTCWTISGNSVRLAAEINPNHVDPININAFFDEVHPPSPDGRIHDLVAAVMAGKPDGDLKHLLVGLDNPEVMHFRGSRIIRRVVIDNDAAGAGFPGSPHGQRQFI